MAPAGGLPPTGGGWWLYHSSSTQLTTPDAPCSLAHSANRGATEAPRAGSVSAPPRETANQISRRGQECTDDHLEAAAAVDATPRRPASGLDGQGQPVAIAVLPTDGRCLLVVVPSGWMVDDRAPVGQWNLNGPAADHGSTPCLSSGAQDSLGRVAPRIPPRSVLQAHPDIIPSHPYVSMTEATANAGWSDRGIYSCSRWVCVLDLPPWIPTSGAATIPVAREEVRGNDPQRSRSSPLRMAVFPRAST